MESRAWEAWREDAVMHRSRLRWRVRPHFTPLACGSLRARRCSTSPTLRMLTEQEHGDVAAFLLAERDRRHRRRRRGEEARELLERVAPAEIRERTRYDAGSCALGVVASRTAERLVERAAPGGALLALRRGQRGERIGRLVRAPEAADPQIAPSGPSATSTGR